MKRRELIKPDLESPFTKLCKPEIAPTTKLFGDDLSKQLKELTEVSRVGKQLQKKAPEQKRFYQKPYDRPRHTSNRKAIMGKKPFLAYSRATFQSGTSHKKSNHAEEPLNTLVSMKLNSPVPLNNSIENYHTLSFTAGQVKNHLCQWETITQDPVILNAIQRYNIEFEETPHLQIVISKNIIFSASEREIFNNEIAKLLSKGVIQGAHYTPDSYISNVFVRSKKDNTHRMILNLKSLNKFVAYHLFKMDIFQTATRLIRPGWFMASVDL